MVELNLNDSVMFVMRSLIELATEKINSPRRYSLIFKIKPQFLSSFKTNNDIIEISNVVANIPMKLLATTVGFHQVVDQRNGLETAEAHFLVGEKEVSSVRQVDGGHDQAFDSGDLSVSQDQVEYYEHHQKPNQIEKHVFVISDGEGLEEADETHHQHQNNHVGADQAAQDQIYRIHSDSVKVVDDIRKRVDERHHHEREHVLVDAGLDAQVVEVGE